MFDGFSVTVIMPCLNEAEGLSALLPQMPAWVDEVLVVDNNSTDASAAIARRHGARVVTETRQGYGWACRRGLREAAGELIVKVDADCTYPLEAMPSLIEAMRRERLDFVSGSRFPLQEAGAMGWLNRVGNRGLTAFANWCFGLSLVDSLSGMWLIRRAVIDRLALHQGGIPFSQEVKVEAFTRLGPRARELRIPYRRRTGVSKLMPLRDGFGCLRYLLARRLQPSDGASAAHGGAAWADRVAVIGFVLAAAWSPIALSVQELGVVLAIGGWIVKRWIERRGLPRHRLALLALLWLLAGALSMINSVSVSASAKGLQKMVKALGVLFAASEILPTRSRISAVVSAILFGAALVSLDGLLQLLWGVDPLYHHPVGDAPGGLARLTATFGHANDFGIYGATVLPLAIAAALLATTPRIRRWTWSVAGLLGASLLLTLSRGGVLAATVGLVIFGLVRRAWKTLAAAAGLAVIALASLPAPLRAWAVAQGSWWGMLVQPERPQMWQTAIEMIRAHPLLGVGVNTFVLNFARYQLPPSVLNPAYAHNHYLHMWAEIGLLGVLAFGALMASLANAWRHLVRQADPWIRTISLGLGCGVIAFLTIGLLESALYSAHTNFHFWLFLGILHGLSMR